MVSDYPWISFLVGDEIIEIYVFLRMNDLHAMPITNITHDACRYTVELGVSAKYFTRITPDNIHTA